MIAWGAVILPILMLMALGALVVLAWIVGAIWDWLSGRRKPPKS